MSRELVPVGDEFHLLDRETGETVALSQAGDDLLADALEHLDEAKRQVADARRVIGDEVIGRMDARALWTMQAGGRKLSAPSPAPTVEWDVPLLRKVLAELVEDGVIGEDAADRACEPVVEWRVHARGITALERIPGVAERIALCRTSTPRQARSVRLGR